MLQSMGSRESDIVTEQQQPCYSQEVPVECQICQGRGIKAALDPVVWEMVHFCQGGLLPTSEHQPNRAQAERGGPILLQLRRLPNPITMKFTHKTDP